MSSTGPIPARGVNLARKGWIALTAVVWVAFLSTAFWPGLMSTDSLVQWQQGLSGDYSNRHPPLVAVVYGIAARWFGNPGPVLVLQLAVMAVAMGSLAARIRPPRLSILMTVPFLLAPPVWAVATTHWKDVLLAALMVAAVAAIAARRLRVATVFMLLAACTRHNAVFAIFPLAFALALRTRRLGSSRPRVVAGVLAILVLAYGTPKLVERVLNAHDDWHGGVILTHDLAAIYLTHPEELAASVFARDVSLPDLRFIYSPYSVDALVHVAIPGVRRIPLESLGPRRRGIMTEWVREVAAHPGVYLRHRLEVFRKLVGATSEPVCYPYHPGIDANPFGFQITESSLFRFLDRARAAAARTWVYRGWFCLACLALLVAISRWKTGWSLPTWTAMSGLVYGSSYFFIAPACEYRLILWSVVAVFAAAALLLVEGPGESCSRPAAPQRC